MKVYSKEALRSVLNETSPTLTLVDDIHHFNTRWYETRILVFEDNSKYYRVYYDRNISTLRVEQPFTFAPAQLECEEVEPYIEQVQSWRKMERRRVKVVV